MDININEEIAKLENEIKELDSQLQQLDKQAQQLNTQRQSLLQSVLRTQGGIQILQRLNQSEK